MSDEFDREEEKRKLREKYAEDQQDREVTGRMSDLLLQGATMTNKHCGRCGSPLFRQNGEEFCPTCRAEGNEPAPEETPSESTPTETETTATPTTEPGNATTGTEPTEPTPEPTQSTTAVERPAPADTATEPSADTATEPSADTATARAALADTIETLARRAADTDDPRRAKDYLEAAHEAANTLTTLD